MGKSSLIEDAVEQHNANAARFFTAIAGEDLEQGSIVMIDESRERIAGMPVAMAMPYGPKRAKPLHSKKQFRRAFGVPCVVHDSVYFSDEDCIAHYVGIEGKRYPIFDVRGYGGHMKLDYKGGKSTESSVLTHVAWPSVGTVGHCDWSGQMPDAFELRWRDSYPTDLAQLIKLFAQGIKA